LYIKLLKTKLGATLKVQYFAQIIAIAVFTNNFELKVTVSTLFFNNGKLTKTTQI